MVVLSGTGPATMAQELPEVPPAAVSPEPRPPASVARDAAGRVTVRAVRSVRPITLDGALDDEVYAEVQPIDGFVQQEPREGQPALQKTDVWLLFDDTNIYVAARCWMTSPGQMVASEMRRDGMGISQNDNFGVLLDTFHDRRNGFLFYTNAVGGMGDSLITDERDTNRDWNTVWDVRTRRFDQGWTVEMVIPFRSLRYPAPRAQVWGVQFRRVVRGVNESSYLTPMPAAYGQRGMVRVSRAATLVGLETPAPSLSFELKPYVLGKVETDLGFHVPVRGDPGADAGFDAKYALKNGLVADLTVNTDFAQVEDDEQQVNLTRFSQFFPERREFFLEGAGLFAFGGASVSPRGGGQQGSSSSTPILFYSRRVGLYKSADATGSVPILGGARLTGRIGAYSVGAMNIQQRAAPDLGAPATNVSVIRLRRDILKQSSVGLIFANRSRAIESPGSNQTIGTDAALTFLRDLTINAYYARTRTGGTTGEDTSYRAGVAWLGDKYGLEAEHLTVEKHFNPEVGFLRRRDFRRNFAMVRYSPRPADPRRVRKYLLEMSADQFTSTSGLIETQQVSAQAGMELQNGDEWRVELSNSYESLSRVFEIAPDVTVPIGGYRFNEVEARYQLGPRRRASGHLTATAGQFYDGTRTSVGYRGRVDFTHQLGLEPGVSFNQVHLIEGSFLATLVTARVNYTLSPRKAFSGLVQYSSAGNVIGANLRFRWEFRPGSDVFVVFNEGRDTELGIRRSELQTRTFVVKVTRLFRF